MMTPGLSPTVNSLVRNSSQNSCIARLQTARLWNVPSHRLVNAESLKHTRADGGTTPGQGPESPARASLPPWTRYRLRVSIAVGERPLLPPRLSDEGLIWCAFRAIAGCHAARRSSLRGRRARDAEQAHRRHAQRLTQFSLHARPDL
jgi:hypothetical protein